MQRSDAFEYILIGLLIGAAVVGVWLGNVITNKNQEIESLKGAVQSAKVDLSFAKADAETAAYDAAEAAIAKAVNQYQKGYKEGQVHVCNWVYGIGHPDPDGWRRTAGSRDGLPLLKATVFAWYADAPAEVPYPVTKSMCLQMARQ